MRIRRAWLLAPALLALAACRSLAPAGPVPIADVVPPGTASFALDPIPNPARARLGDHVLPAVAVTYVDLPDLGPEAYVLDVYEDGGRTVARIAASGPRGRTWGRFTLTQLTAVVGDREFFRACHIEDAPALPLRGSKRPLPFEALYKANLAWEKFEGAPDRAVRVAVLSPGGTLDATDVAVAAALRSFEERRARGANRFAIEFDDVGFDLTPESRDRFGAYAPALLSFLRGVRRGLPADAVLYWLPQTYRTADPRLPVLARELRLAGGLPPDLGLVVTGPETISERIAAADVAAARGAFGLTARPALVYDNLGREGDHGPLTGRDPGLVAEADGVFGERGEILNRITRLDWSWNPRAYDPARSHLLACREVAGAAAAPALSRLIRGGERLPAAERARLAAEVRARFAPPPGREAIPDARAYVERILSAAHPGP